MFFTSSAASDKLLSQFIDIPASLQSTTGSGQQLYQSAIIDTCGLMIIFPLVILYAFCQKFLVQGIEHSGIAN